MWGSRVATRSLAQLERDVLTLIVRDQPIGRALDLLVGGLEQDAAPGTLGSILLVSAGGRLRHGSAPRLPAEYTAAIDGAPVGEGRGSCGTAAARIVRTHNRGTIPPEQIDTLFDPSGAARAVARPTGWAWVSPSSE